VTEVLIDGGRQCGTVGEQGIIMPPPQPVVSERLERHGLYLIEDGQTMFLWVGRDAVSHLIMDVFNLPSYDVLRGGKVRAFRQEVPLLLMLVLGTVYSSATGQPLL
jgi:protein transport protein SEC24